MSRANRLRNLIVALALPMLLGSVGCNTYTYFEVHATLEPVTFGGGTSAMINSCRVVVSGATADEFNILKNCPPFPLGGLDIGTFEYATFDEGNVAFTLMVFRGIGETDIMGKGTVTLAASPGKTVMGDLKVNVATAP